MPPDSAAGRAAPAPALFLLPGLVTLGCFLLYGPAEAMIHASSLSGAALPLYALFTIALFLLAGWGLLRMKRVLEPPRTLLALSIALLAASAVLYLRAFDLAAGNVQGRGNPVFLSIPNPVPGLLTVGPELKLATYHVVIFGEFFPLLYWALALPLLWAPGVPRLGTGLRLFAAWLGWGALGLAYQDWFYFVAHPTQNLVPGGRYGVYFTHWLGPVPTFYLVAHLWAFGMLWLAWRGTRAAPRLGRGWALVGLFAAGGVALTLAKPAWAG
ncbi:MAG: hypothetical protein QXO51_05205 [Halobacteria archaeon]